MEAQHTIWCDEDDHRLYEFYADFNVWLDGEEGQALREQCGIDGLNQPSKAFYAGDKETYDEAFRQYRIERRHEMLNQVYLEEQFGGDHWFQRNHDHFMHLRKRPKPTDAARTPQGPGPPSPWSGSHAPAWEPRADAPASRGKDRSRLPDWPRAAGAAKTAFPRWSVGTRDDKRDGLMQLERLKIKAFRNLHDFEIGFTGSATNVDGSERRFKSHAVIGQNGSGKSNMIEAIVTIFRDLDLNQKTGFGYELDYTCRGHRIRIDAMADKGKVTITERDADKAKTFALSHLQRYAKRILPSHVFAYYSGRNDRIEARFQQHQQRLYDALISGRDELMRRLFYCRSVHSQFVLLRLVS